jgi:hypothetical protein
MLGKARQGTDKKRFFGAAFFVEVTMATGFEFFERDLRLSTVGLEPQAIAKELAKFARSELSKVLAAGASPQYETFVNGRSGAPLESVIPPGPILFVFSNWSLVIRAALAELQRRAPRRSGRYAGSFIVVVGGRTVVTDYSKIRADSEVVIFNAQPYTRRIETGYNGPGKRHFDLARGALNRRFKGAFEFEMKYVDVPGGINPLVPYKLKRTTKRRAAGTALTYPALIINAV